MADAQATFGIAIDVEHGSADDAADALEKLRDEIAGDTEALRDMQKAMRGLQSGTNVSIQTFRTLRDQITAKKIAVADANQKLIGMKGAFDKLTPATRKSNEEQKHAALIAKATKLALKDLAKDSLGLTGGWARVGGAALDAGGKFAIAGAAAIGIVLAVGAATAALYAFGIAAADARRNELLMTQAAGTFLWNMYGMAASKAGDLTEASAHAIQGAVDRVSASVSIGRDKVNAFSNELLQARLSGKDLETALKAVSTAASVGKEAGLVGAFASIRFMGGSVDKLAAKVQAKFGGIVSKQMLSLGTQAAKLKESWNMLFRDVNIEPLLKGLHEILSLFSVSTVSGYALREAVTEIFKPLGGVIEFLTPLVKGFFKGMVIAALMFGIALLTVRNYWRDTFGSDAKSEIDLLMVGVYAGVGVGLALAGAFGLAAISIAACVAPFVALGAVVVGIGFAIGYSVAWIADQFVWLYDNFSKINWSQLGSDLIDGLINGIKAGASRAWDAIKDLGSGLLKNFKDVMGIRSPSKPLRAFGRFMPQGLVQGIHDEAPKAQAAIEGVISIPSSVDAPAIAKASVGDGGDGGGGPRSVVVHLEMPPGAIVIQGGGKTTPDMLAELETKVADMFERAAQQIGAQLEVT